MTSSLSIRGRLACRKRHISIPLDSLAQWVGRQSNPAILGTNPASRWGGRYSIFAFDPVDTLEIPHWEPNPLSVLREGLNRYALDSRSRDLLPDGFFCGGWIGFFSYDLCRHLERIEANPAIVDDLQTPLIRLCLYDRAFVYDHSENILRLIAVSFPGDSVSSSEKLEGLDEILTQAAQYREPVVPRFDSDTTDPIEIQSRTTRQDYDNALRSIHQYILDGEIYQINFSRRFSSPFLADPRDLFRWHNQHNPSPFAAYLDTGDISIVSASPEMFLTLCGEKISTQPIKGTRPRSQTGPDCETFNRTQCLELLNSAKEQAELNMIVDLERNDLHRICRPGTVEVVQPRTLETFATLFHAVATIAGSLRRPPLEYGLSSFCEILRAVFPGGSITGAPKIRAMQIIEQLEPVRRGLYTGNIGFLGLDGTACLNIAIRTCIITCGRAHFHTGGGIVVDSDPDAEWEETRVKARALWAGLSAASRYRPPMHIIS